jgi:hypothetical protein
VNSAVKNIIFWVVMAVTALLIWAVVKSSTSERVTELTFSAFMDDVNKDNVKTVTTKTSSQRSRTLREPHG